MDSAASSAAKLGFIEMMTTSPLLGSSRHQAVDEQSSPPEGTTYTELTSVITSTTESDTAVPSCVTPLRSITCSEGGSYFIGSDEGTGSSPSIAVPTLDESAPHGKGDADTVHKESMSAPSAMLINVNGQQQLVLLDSSNSHRHLTSQENEAQVIGLSHIPISASPHSPLSQSLDSDEPLYVNAKQYQRILKRREARARLEARGRIQKERPKYLYSSRHAHALKRVRGPRGTFLKKEPDSNLPSDSFGTMNEKENKNT